MYIYFLLVILHIIQMFFNYLLPTELRIFYLRYNVIREKNKLSALV